MTSAHYKIPAATLADGFHTYVFDWDERGMR